MKLRTVCLLALFVVPASYSGPASSNPVLPPSIASSDARCVAVAASAIAVLTQRKLCSGPIVIAQTPREQCIQICHDTYNGGEPLKNCIRQCPAQ